LFLKIPPQAEDVEVVAPSVLHFIQKSGGGFQNISLITGDFGG
jgi:hypothetical protein